MFNSTGNLTRACSLGFVRRQIQYLNGIVLLSLAIAAVIVTRFMYEVLDYLPSTSIVALALIAAGLSLLCMLVSKLATSKAICTIDTYFEKLDSLLNLPRDVQTIRHMDEMLEQITGSVFKITNAKACMVALLDGDYLKAEAVVSDSGPMDELYGTCIEKGRGVVGMAAQRGRQIKSPVHEASGLFEMEADLVGIAGGEVVIAAPMINEKGMVVGVIEVAVAGGMSEDNEKILQYIADYSARAIEDLRWKDDEHCFGIHVTNILVNAMESHINKKGHSGKVVNYALHIAGKLGLSPERKALLHKAALLHDIGMLKLPAEDATIHEYMNHSKYGYEMLKPIGFLSDVAEIVLHHHERFDGKGFPYGRRGNEIPLESRIISIAEAFDAILNNGYGQFGAQGSSAIGPKGTMEAFHEAVAVLKEGAASKYDPELVEAFVRTIEIEDVVGLMQPYQMEAA